MRELLQAPLHVDEAAGFLEGRQSRQDDAGGARGGVRVRAEINHRDLGELGGGESGGRQVFAADEDGLHFAGVDGVAESGERGFRRRGDQSRGEGAARVRRPVLGDQQAVAVAESRACRCRTTPRDGLRELREQILFLDGEVGRTRHTRPRPSRSLADGLRQGFGRRDFFSGDRGFAEAVRRRDGLEKFASGVRHPGVVHGVVAARRDAVDDALAAPDGGVHAGRRIPVQIESVSFRNHTRILNRKSVCVSAPTGQMSTVLSE